MQTKSAKKMNKELLMLGIDVPIRTRLDGKKCPEYARLEKVSKELRGKLRASETILITHEWEWPDLSYGRGRTYGQREEYYGLDVTLVKAEPPSTSTTETKVQGEEKEEAEGD